MTLKSQAGDYTALEMSRGLSESKQASKRMKSNQIE